MEIYFYIVAIVIILGIIMPQTGPKRKNYIILMTILHTFVCAFRYEHLTGDLMKYHYAYLQYDEMGWLSEELLQGGRNSGFFLFCKLISQLSGEDFQALLIVIAVITHVVLAYVVYRYSPAPWLSYLIWNCMGLYIFGFNAIKQALAMAFLMLAFIGIAERRLKFYLLMMAIAVSIHMPALIFLPAYWLSGMKINFRTIFLYLVVGISLFVFKNQFVELVKLVYYETEEEVVYSGNIGGRFYMVLGFTLFGLLFSGFSDKNMRKVFHLMAIASMLQLLAGFDHIFTRLTDYYFQFSVLYIPMVFFPSKSDYEPNVFHPAFPFNARSLKVLSIFVCVFMLWFYYVLNLNSGIPVSGTSYLNFQFMWDVK